MYNQPPPGQGGYGRPAYGAPPHAQPQYGAPPGQPGYGPPPSGGGYGAPPSQQYGAPPSQQYGAPPPQQYGAPPPQQYGAPPPQQYGAPPSQQYGAPPQQHGAPPPFNPAAPPAGYHGAPPPQHGTPQCPPGVDPQVFNWFIAVNADRSGQITAQQLQQALTNQNWTHFNSETCRLMIGMFDRNHSGTIDLQEFQALWNYIQQWKGVFERYDRDRSGFIEVGELCQAWNEMGYRLSPQFAAVAVRRFDKSGRNGLTLDYFIQACVLLRSLTEGFKAKDVQQTGQIRINYEDFLTMVLLNKI